MLTIMEVWGFQPKYITKKPAAHFLFNSLAVLVSHSQAQKCLQIDATFVLRCVSVLFADNSRCKIVIAQCGFLLAFSRFYSEEIWNYCRELYYNVICLQR